MHPRHLVIDGYCLLHRDPDTAPLVKGRLAEARRRLVRKAESLAGAFAARVTIVFDGQSRGPGEEFDNLDVEVMYTAGHESADSYIQRLACRTADADELVVVTSDRGIIDSVLASGGQVMSCAEFLDRYREQLDRARRTVRQTQVRRRHTLGDYFP